MDTLCSPELFRGLMAGQGWTVRGLAEAARVSPWTIQHVLQGCHVQRHTSEAVAATLGLPWDVLFTTADGSPRPFLTVAETAKVLGLSQDAVYKHVKRGHLPSHKVGGRVLVPRAHVEGLLSA